jgi:hypothetical protein
MLNEADGMKPAFGFCNNSSKNLTGISTQIGARSKPMGIKDRVKCYTTTCVQGWVRSKNDESRKKRHKLMLRSVILISWRLTEKRRSRCEYRRRSSKKVAWGKEGGSPSPGRKVQSTNISKLVRMMTLHKCKCELLHLLVNFLKGTRYGKSFDKFWGFES